MHVYFLVIFHCLLDKEMEIYVTCILEVMKRLRLRYPNQVMLSHSKKHKRLAEALACM